MLRRSFLHTVALAGVSRADRLPPVRTITRGPKFHWFAYYDKLQFDPTSRYVLGNQVGFEHRSPRPDDEIRVGMIDLGDNDRWTDLGTSTAWNWQQGCMLQWIPGSRGEVIWNDRSKDGFVSHILDVKSGRRRTLPAPVYSVSPDGRWAVYPDYRRLNDTRPGYGYCGIADPYVSSLAPKGTGLWKLDLQTGTSKLLFPFSEIAAIPYHVDLSQCKHWFNHLLVSPDGKRFLFLHRWHGEPGRRSFGTRMFSCDADGKDLYCIDPRGGTSHFIWRDPQHVLAWATHPSHGAKFYLFRDKTEHVEVVAPEVMPLNGHCTYLPGNRWILNDTYPDKGRNQNVYLYDTRTGRRVPLGHFHSPPEYTGEWRCDTHPRFSPNGKLVTIDSPHNGGRQIHLIDISGLVG